MQTNFFLLFFVLCLLFQTIHMMSEAQMKAAARLPRNVCQPKSKVTNAQIDAMHAGEWDNDEKAQCYMSCVLKMLKVIKNGKYDMQASLKAAQTLPPRYQEPTKITLDVCKDSITSENICEAGYQMAKCMYFRSPEFYFLP